MAIEQDLLERLTAKVAEREQQERAASKAKDDELRAAKVAEQVATGRCNIIPLPGKCASKPFRADLYTEALPLFVANGFKGESRELVREHKHPETGERIVDRLVVGRVAKGDKERGVLKQKHQDALYQLLRLWGEGVVDGGEPHKILKGDNDEHPRGVLVLSAYRLVMELFGNDGATRYRDARILLADLRGIPVSRELHYMWRDEYDECSFTLLGDVLWEGQRIDRKTGRPAPGGSSEVKIEFSEFLTRQFLEHRVKQLLMTPYLQLARTKGRRGELAPLLYTRLDRELATKSEYHIKLASLFDELGFTSYRYRAHRKKKAAPALAALNGLPILGERFTLRVSLRPSADGDDYVLVAERIGQEPLPSVE